MEPADVPAGPLAIDTDAFSFIHLKKGQHAKFGALIAGHSLAMPFPVVGELEVLAIRSNWGSVRRNELQSAIASCIVIPSDSRIVQQWADLRARLISQLKGEGINDLWTAACCLLHGLPIVTANLSDFQTIASKAPSLQIVHPDV